jgi:hypothetical protein
LSQEVFLPMVVPRPRAGRLQAIGRHLAGARLQCTNPASTAATAATAADVTADTSPFAQLDADEYNVPDAVIARTPSPALFVFMDAVRHNIRTMIQQHCGGDASRWRPHLKTTKMAPVFKALLDAGVRRFKCATPKEARVLLGTVREAGVKAGVDLLVAYPHVEPNLSVLSQLSEEFPESQLSVLVESAQGVADAAAGRLGLCHIWKMSVS